MNEGMKKMMELLQMEEEEFDDVLHKIYQLAGSHIDTDALNRKKPGLDVVARDFAFCGFIQGVAYTVRCIREGRADDLMSKLLNREHSS